MKILQINVVYARGSTGTIVLNLHRQYAINGLDSYVIYGRGQKPIESNVYKTTAEFGSNVHHFIANIFDNVYGGLPFATSRLIRTINKIKPDVVHVHCINGYFVNIYKLINYLKKKGIKTVITNHAEFYYTSNCGYSFECDKWRTCCKHCPHIKEFNSRYSIDRTKHNYLKMKKAFNSFNKDNIVVASVSPWVTDRSKSSPILGQYKHVTILNGFKTDKYICYDKEDIRKELNLPLNKQIYSFICSNWNENSKKEYFYKVVDSIKDAIFILIGAPKDENVPSNVINVGYINNQTLMNKYLSSSDKLLSLSKRETFSLPVAESLCSGTPVVGFFAGGPETICIDKYCSFCDYGDIDILINLINKDNKYDRLAISKEAKDKYSLDNMANGYISIYKELLNNGK